MYLIINKTQNKLVHKAGGFPDMQYELDRGDKIIIISLYSNTIKVPYCTVQYGENVWDWEEYELPIVNGVPVNPH